MAFLRQRTRGNYALAWKWKGSSYIKGLGTKDLAEAKRIKQDAVDQLARIRSGESALASKLLADSHSILDVLFGADEIGHLIASPADDNPLTLSQLKEAFIDNLGVTRRIDFLKSWSREDVGSNCGVCGASGPADDSAVHPLLAQGQARHGQFDSV